MKMPEKHDLLARHSRGKGTRHRGNHLRLQWRTFAADIMAVRLQKQYRRNDERHYRLVHIRDLLDFAGLSSNLAYITSVFIGYIGTDSIGSLIKRFAAKAGVEDGEINNQRKAFLDMLAWSEGTDNGRQKTRNHGYDVVAERAIYDYSRHPRKLVTLKLARSASAGRYQLLFRWWDAYRKQLGLKDFSRRSQDAVAAKTD